MQVRYLDGFRLQRAILAGTQRLIQAREHLDTINVFPVADGDTGTNMAATARSVSVALASLEHRAVGATAREAAASALSGARGNSGAILAQFFHGLSKAIGDRARISADSFARAAKAAVDATYGALAEPKEGTILTVLKDWSRVFAAASSRTGDYVEALGESLKAARESLIRTRDMLPEMRRAKVVDAGAQGFVDFLEGIVAFIGSGTLRDFRSSSDLSSSDWEDHSSPLGDFDEELTYRYCTECLLSGSRIDTNELRSVMQKHGDSLIVAGDDDLVKLHIHTDDPPAVFGMLTSFGDVVNPKVDDMEIQRSIARAEFRQRCRVVVDSASDLPDQTRQDLGILRVPVRLGFDGRDYLDRDGISAEEFYDLLASEDSGAPSTSQPNPADFSRSFRFGESYADEVVYVGLSSALSGTLQVGRTVAQDMPSVRVLDSRSISVPLGLIARRAAEAARDGATAADVEALVADLSDRSTLLVAVPDLTGLIRSGRLAGLKGVAANALGIRPLLTTDEVGRAALGGAYFGAARGVRALKRRIVKSLPKAPWSGQGAEFAIAHIQNPQGADELAEFLEERYPDARQPYITTVSPALAAHAGLGGLVVGLLSPKDEPR